MLVHRFSDAVETDNVVGARKDDTLDVVAARGFEHVVSAGDVVRKYLVPRALARNAGKMDDAIDALRHRDRSFEVGHIGDDVLLARPDILAGEHIREPQQSVAARKACAQDGSDLAGGAGDEYAFHMACADSGSVPL